MLTEIQVLHWDLVYHQYFLILQSPSPGVVGVLLRLRERPLMTSDFRVGRGFKMTQKIGRFRVEKGR